MYIDMGEYDRALAHLESALEIEQRQGNTIDPLSLAITLSGFGCVYSGQGRKREALTYFERAVQLIPERHPQRINALKRLGSALSQMGETAAAHDTLRQAIALNEQQKENANELELAEIFHSIGLLHCRSGEFDNAVEAYERALAIRRRLLPAVHPATAKLYNELGGVCLEKGDYEQALTYFQQTRVIESETLSEGHIELARTYHNIGVTLFKMGKIAEALIEEEKALSIMLGKQLGASHPLLNTIQQTLSKMRAITILADQLPSIIQQEHQ
jgi:tetratricopeptide (TPR) repeat protein